MIAVGEPSGFWLLILLFLILAVLARKSRRRKVALSTFFLLQPLVQKLGKLNRHFQLIRRLALICFIGAALSIVLAGLSPYYSSGARPRSELIIVDLSPSMGIVEDGRSRFQTMINNLSDHLGDLQEKDTVFFVCAASRATATHRDITGLAAADLVKGLEYDDAAADIKGALDLAETALGGRLFDHFLIFTDMPSRWTGTGRPELQKQSPPRFVTFGTRRPNSGIVAFDMRRDPFGEGAYDLFVRFTCPKGLSPEDAGSAELLLSNNGLTRSIFEGGCRAGEEKEVILGGLALLPGRVKISLEPGGAYEGDDTVLAGISREGTVKINAVTSGNVYLQKMLEAGLSAGIAVYEPGGEVPMQEEAIYIFDGITPGGRIPRQALFIYPDGQLPGLTHLGGMAPGNIIKWDRSSPVMRGVQLEDLSVDAYLAYDEAADISYPATVDGHPLILLKSGFGNRWAVLAFDPSRTDFVYSPSYPVLMANLIRWLAYEADAEPAFLRTGEMIFLPESSRGGYVVGPGGGRIDLPGGPGDGPMPVDGRRAGTYRVFSRGGGLSGEFYVNVLDPSVSDEAGRSGDPAGTTRAALDIKRAPGRINFGPYLALIAIMLLAGETALSGNQSSGREDRG